MVMVFIGIRKKDNIVIAIHILFICYLIDSFSMEYYEDITEFKKGYVKCTLCNKTLSDNSTDIESHINDDKEHKKNYLSKIMIQNNVVFREDYYYCYPCKTNISNKTSFICHVKTLSHTRIIEDIQKLIEEDGSYLELPKNISDTYGIYCDICDRYCPLTLDDTKEHIASDRHKKFRAMVVQPLNAIFSVDNCNDEYLFCKICKIYFENYVELIFQHIREGSHKETIDKIKLIIKNQHIDIEKYFTIPTQDTVYCKVCNKNIPCNVTNLMTHIDGKSHKNSIGSEE